MGSEEIHGMTGVEDKEETLREARAHAEIRLSKEVIRLIRERGVAKGDVLEQSRLAGVMAAKKTPDIIPLCHPLRLTNVRIEFDVKDDRITVESYVAARDRTGVEMEALTAVSAACLNIYDMCKRYDRSMVIECVYLLEKKGGRSEVFKCLSV